MKSNRIADSGQAAELITKARKQIGKTQEEIADIIGISRRQYQRYESGEKNLLQAPYWIVKSILRELHIPEKQFDSTIRSSGESESHETKKM